jgi:protein-ribulosamine 3-kinase
VLSKNLTDQIIEILNTKINSSIEITAVSPVSGGCINNAVKLHTTSGDYFLKWNNAAAFPGMFEAEAKGLNLLNATKSFRIPKVIAAGTADKESFLLLEFIQPGHKTCDYWRDFGTALAELHRNTNSHFGLNHPNYIGFLPQQNNFHSSWSEFFVLKRIEPQIRIAKNAGKINQQTTQKFQQLFSKIPEIFPEEKPALLHGDLWSGNIMATAENQPCIYDPAVYFGHREMDLAMSKLFWGFDNLFYQNYNEHYPLEKNWQKRSDICNLYPLMVHVNLFGGGYLSQVEAILRPF